MYLVMKKTGSNKSIVILGLLFPVHVLGVDIYDLVKRDGLYYRIFQDQL